MKRYVISWYDHFTMIIKMEIVDVESEGEALQFAFKNLTKKVANTKNISLLKQLAREADGAIEAFEIYEPDHVSAHQVIKRFLKGAANALPSKGLPQYAH